MDFKEYIQIIRKNINLFMAVIAVIVLGSFAVVFLRPIAYSTSLMLNIARNGSQETADYKYDDFYRIQADEKFAETVVQWMKSPAVIADVFAEAGIDANKLSLRQLAKSFKAEKLSSQIVAVSFATPNNEQAKKLSSAISKVIAKNIDSLNTNKKINGWFEISAHDPIIIKDSFSPLVVLLASLLAGIFVAFWTVLIIHYLK